MRLAHSFQAGHGYLSLEAFADDFLQDEQGNQLVRSGQAYRGLSPLASEAAYQTIADFYLELTQILQDAAPIRLMINGGEYGFAKPQFVPLSVTLRDPRVLDAWSEDGRPWIDFASDHKARHERVMRRAFAQAFPDMLYFHYSEVAGGHPRRMGTRTDWHRYDFLYREGVSDLASSRDGYYRHGNSGFVGQRDILSKTLNSTAQEIDAGVHHSYRWVSGGWYSRGNFADHDRYEGYLKSMYTSGSLGAIVGYFGGRPHIDPVEHSLPQYLILGRVHAFFSHLDEFLLNSHLLPGPDSHRWSRDLPAYEFPTGHEHARVLIRQHNDRPEWLITAWAADGQAREVRVMVPGLGAITIQATPSATVRLIEQTDAGPRDLDPKNLPQHATPQQLQDRLNEIVEQYNPTLQQARATRLVDTTEPNMISLEPLLEHHNTFVRQHALAAVVQHHPDLALNHLAAALNEPAEATRVQAVRGLIQLHQQGRNVMALFEQVREDTSQTIQDLLAEHIWPFQPPAVSPTTIAYGRPDLPAADQLDLAQQHWRFQTDPARHGHVDAWFASDLDDTQWEITRIGQPWEDGYMEPLIIPSRAGVGAI